MVNTEGLGLVDPTSLAYWEDIFGTLAPLREQWPVVRSTAGDFEILRYADIEPLLHDSRRLHQALSGMLANQGITSGPLYEWWQFLMNNKDGLEHTRLRSLVSRTFTPKQVRDVRPRIRQVAHELVDGLEDGGETDMIASFCHRLPLVVLCEMLGVPGEDVDRFDQWTTAVASAFTAVIPPEHRSHIEESLVAFNGYIDELVADRRDHLGTDLLSSLIQAEEAGDRLSTDELRALVINLLFAGHDTTKSLLGIGIWLLASHPDQLAVLRADPSLMPSAVEEIARYETPISGIPRMTTEDITVSGVAIPEGSYVTLSVPSANRDPRQFPDADRFDVTRADNRHLTFGFGAHHCVGAAVARAEAQESLAVVVERCPEIEVLADKAEWVPFQGTRKLASLPLRLKTRSR
jgi:cytochrome P450